VWLAQKDALCPAWPMLSRMSTSPAAAGSWMHAGLMLACHEGHEQVVRALLEAEADPMLKDNFGNTCMWVSQSCWHCH
jgi:ankyrin repeat protein